LNISNLSNSSYDRFSFLQTSQKIICSTSSRVIFSAVLILSEIEVGGRAPTVKLHALTAASKQLRRKIIIIKQTINK
jgi:hypothetical protein